jgi:CheY-like chemotaxis protein
MSEFVHSLSELAWPLLAAVVLFKLLPEMRDLMRQRDIRAKGGLGGIEVEIGGQPITTQRAIDDQRREIEDVRAQLSLLAMELARIRDNTAVGAAQRSLAPSAPPPVSGLRDLGAAPYTKKLLWVDGSPTDNAYEIAALGDRGVVVETARTTAEALTRLDSDPAIDAVVTGVRRVENGVEDPVAGLALLRAVSKAAVSVPIFVYATAAQAARMRDEILELGGLGVSASATELFELLGVNTGPRFAERLVNETAQVLVRGGARNVTALDGPVDLSANVDGRHIGVEVKPWMAAPVPRAVHDVVARLSGLVQTRNFDEIWIITPIQLPSLLTTEDAQVRLETIASLRRLT